MQIHRFNTPTSKVKYWHLLLLQGVLFIFVGIGVLKTSPESFLTLAIFFSFIFFVSGGFEIFYYISNRATTPNWIRGFSWGIFNVLFSIWLISSPQASIKILHIYIGVMLIFRSIKAIAAAIELKNSVTKGWEWLLSTGLIGMIFSFMVIWNLFFGGIPIIFWTAWVLIIIGTFRLIMSFDLKIFRKEERINQNN